MKCWIETGEEGEYTIIDYLDELEQSNINIIFIDVKAEGVIIND